MHKKRAQHKLPIQQPKQREHLRSSVTYKALYNLQSLRRRSQAQLSKKSRIVDCPPTNSKQRVGLELP